MLILVLRSFFLELFRVVSIQIEDNEDECCSDGSECSKEVWIGNKKESLELVMFVGTNSDSLCFFDEIISWFFIDDFVLIDPFF